MAETRIVVNGDTWLVPRGFGAEYKRVLKLEREFQGAGLNELLGLVGYTATEKTIAGWSLRQRVEASVYAANVHARASDNPIAAYPRPDWFPEAWRGPSNGPTPIGLRRCKPGAWGGAGCLAHEGFTIGDDGMCIEGRTVASKVVGK